MSFAPVPTESKAKIKKAGAILVSDNPTPEEYKWAINLLIGNLIPRDGASVARG